MLSLAKDTRSSSGSHSRSASASGVGRRSGEMDAVAEEDDDEVEEVEVFSPVIQHPGETVEEQIYEEDEGDGPSPFTMPGPPMTPIR